MKILSLYKRDSLVMAKANNTKEQNLPIIDTYVSEKNLLNPPEKELNNARYPISRFKYQSAGIQLGFIQCLAYTRTSNSLLVSMFFSKNLNIINKQTEQKIIF